MSASIKLSGRNFQSWESFDLTLAGLTVLTGPSDTGKSAIFRALKGVLRNELPSDWIRNDQDESLEVRLELDNHIVTVKRPLKGSTTYTIDDKVFAKLAGAIPDKVKELKFGDVVIGEYDVDPIFGRQNSPQFLIDPDTFKPPEVNAILGAFGGTEKLEHGKKEANLRKTQKDAEARTLAVQIRDAEERKAALTIMQTQGDSLETVLQELEATILIMELENHWLEQAITCRQRIIPLREIQETLILPDISDLELMYQQIEKADQAAEATAYAKWLKKPSTITSAVVGQWDEARRHWNLIEALGSTVEAGKHIVSTDKLKAALQGVETLYSDTVGLWGGIKELEVLGALLDELSDSTNRLVGVESELLVAQTEAQKGLCPKCGSPMFHVCKG
jgi:exonuclease SbcC